MLIDAPEFLEKFARLLIDDRLSVSVALKDLGICRCTYYQRLREDEGFYRAVNAIRQDQAEVMADELMAIADDSGLQHSLRHHMIETRKWYLCKIVPRFKDRAEVDITSKGERIAAPLDEDAILIAAQEIERKRATQSN